MGYVGNQTTNSYSSMDKQVITGNGGASYTLTHAVANAQEIEVFVNNVRQEAGIAYTVNGTALSMTGNVASTDDFYVIYQGKALQTVVPPDGSISTAKLASGSVTDTKIDTMAASKLTGTIDDARFAANMPIQIITNTYDTELTLSGSFQDTGLYATITPKYSNSKILVQWCINYKVTDTGANMNIHEHIFRDSTRLDPNSDGIKVLSGYQSARIFQTSSLVDEPATTSAITYKIQAKEGSGDAGVAHENNNPSIMILTEIRQ